MRLSPFLIAAVAAAGLLSAGCAPTHRLADVVLDERTVAVTAPIPPTPRMVTGPWPYVDQQVQPPPGEVRRRFQAARAAQARLDTAAAEVDVAETLARQALLESARTLRFRPENVPEAAELILDVRLLEFSFHARSFDSRTYAYVESVATLSRTDTNEIIWERRFRERDVIHAEIFAAADLGRLLTPRLMTRLSTDEFVIGIERLALQAADCIARRLHDEYRQAHR